MFKALAIFVSLISLNSFALEFNSNETPFQTLDRAWEQGQTIQHRDFPSFAETSDRLKVMKILEIRIDERTTLREVRLSPIQFIVKSSQKTTIPGEVDRGPLFPATPDTSKEALFINYCKNFCLYQSDVHITGSFLVDKDNSSWVTYDNATWWQIKKFGDAVIFKKIFGDKEYTYYYGWIQK